ncbi:unnamed protein product [Didymodactylos carnosus]|uniref:Vacuolar ATPase assembly protein VMA22 n=1 Tax=Didymodactylos carnosus TaxID=1234261 RepID=A0A813XC94_9BILA|nr:unnamed protein product [Didymodactylos carnosus]CAF1219440.1 unnamed protein product [Didymodactylos carnosus]CAF3653635.1 unnamed protein product [Didymodactylos carnosus]CAF4027651.1 unnamed protein product [Didymodactylos carnosus]
MVDTVCKQLDDLTLDYLQTFGHLLNLKLLLEQSMKNGYFSISRSRVIMGVNQLSSLQFPDTIQPCTYIEFNEDEIEKHIDEKQINTPLKWFGILTPQTLKQGQKYFLQSIDLALECIHVQTKLERLKNNMHRLSKEKMILIEDIKENIEPKSLIESVNEMKIEE